MVLQNYMAGDVEDAEVESVLGKLVEDENYTLHVFNTCDLFVDFLDTFEGILILQCFIKIYQSVSDFVFIEGCQRQLASE